MVRKTATISIGTFVTEPYQAVIVASSVAVLSLFAHLELTPFDRRWLNLLEGYALATLVITQVASLIFLRSEDLGMSRM